VDIGAVFQTGLVIDARKGLAMRFGSSSAAVPAEFLEVEVNGEK
jgi:hypothetical protein